MILDFISFCTKCSYLKIRKYVYHLNDYIRLNKIFDDLMIILLVKMYGYCIDLTVRTYKKIFFHEQNIVY